MSAYNSEFVKSYPRGITGRIEYDPDPRPYDGDTLGKIAYLKRSRYTLGNEAVTEERMREIEEGIESGEYIGLTIYAYVHSGATIRAETPFSCPWDSGRSGFVYTTKERAESEFPGNPDGALGCLRSEVRVYAAYLEGEVFGWVVEDADGETIESCWGFYGRDEFDYMTEEMDAVAENHIKGIESDEAKAEAAARAEAAEALYWAERDVVTT